MLDKSVPGVSRKTQVLHILHGSKDGTLQSSKEIQAFSWRRLVKPSGATPGVALEPLDLSGLGRWAASVRGALLQVGHFADSPRSRADGVGFGHAPHLVLQILDVVDPYA